MFGSELPSWKQILVNRKKVAMRSYWNDENLIWTSQTAASIKLIIENYSLYEMKDIVRVWIPDFFCVETEQLFSTEKVQIQYYPINEKYEPDWRILKEIVCIDIPDIFIFVHYFGVYHDISRAKEFCKRYGTLLIEDCAHVLYNSGKFGLKGDFTVYSPHKILPVCDGGIISYNGEDKRVQEIVKGIKKQLEMEKKAGNCVSWRIKKALQKVTKIRKSTAFKVEPHYINEKNGFDNKIALQISTWSYNTISAYGYEEIKKIAYTRRENLYTMNYIVSKLVPNAVPLMSSDVICPYVGLYSVKNIDDKQAAVEKLEKVGILVTFWPTLSEAVKELKYKSIAIDLSSDLLVVPIHQGMTPQYMLDKYLPNIERANITYKFEKIDCNMECREGYECVEVTLNNIPQDLIYGRIKSAIECDELNRYKIYNPDGQFIGVLQALIKKRYGIKYAVRVNRGPIMVKDYNTPDIIFQIMEQFKKMMGLLPVFYAPNIEFSPYNMHLACSYKWKCWNRFGYSSGMVDLEDSVKELRKKLESKWRNQLVSAEKRGLSVINDSVRYKEFLEIYIDDQQKKEYVGIPKEILESLFELEDSPLDIYYVVNEKNNILAFDIIYRQRKTAHYLVGWNSSEGRKWYLNNLLLYHAVISLKEKGISQFDLGGINYIDTEDIARFKDGMNPKKYQLMGELVKIF